jgi:DNA-binding NarL/FixJ family response regulator
LDSTNCQRISVFTVDDHAGFRDSLRDLIGGTPGFVLIGEASSGADAIVLVPELRPDLVLIDVHMPGMSGFEAATRLATEHCAVLIVLMSADAVEAPCEFGFRDGEIAMVTKPELSPRRLLELWQGRETVANGQQKSLR